MDSIMDAEENEPTLGEIIDRLGVSVGLNEGDIITDAVVLVKILDKNGKPSMATVWNEGIGVFERTGLLRIAMIGDENGFQAVNRKQMGD